MSSRTEQTYCAGFFMYKQQKNIEQPQQHSPSHVNCKLQILPVYIHIPYPLAMLTAFRVYPSGCPAMQSLTCGPHAAWKPHSAPRGVQCGHARRRAPRKTGTPHHTGPHRDPRTSGDSRCMWCTGERAYTDGVTPTRRPVFRGRGTVTWLSRACHVHGYCV